MFGIGSMELLVILIVALIVLGPRNVPRIARTLGKAMGEFRKYSTEFQRTLNTEIAFEEQAEKKRQAEQKRERTQAAQSAPLTPPSPAASAESGESGESGASAVPGAASGSSASSASTDNDASASLQK